MRGRRGDMQYHFAPLPPHGIDSTGPALSEAASGSHSPVMQGGADQEKSDGEEASCALEVDARPPLNHQLSNVSQQTNGVRRNVKGA